MAPTPEELADIWVKAVRRLGRSDRYRIRVAKWRTALTNACAFLEQHPDIDPVEFAEAQVAWVIANRVQDAVWPSLMSGPKALERYREYGSRTERDNATAEFYAAQTRVFSGIQANMGIDAALTDATAGWSPLFLAYQYFRHKGMIPEHLKAPARKELDASPNVSAYFDTTFLPRLYV